MTTTTPTRPGTTRPTRPAGLSPAERRGARLAGAGLLVLALVSLPAAALLDRADEPRVRVAVGAAFAVVALLDVVVGWGLHLLLRRTAAPASVATVVSRAGYAVLLAGAALALAVPGGDGVARFRADWALALVVFGVHLLVASVALWRSRLAPAIVVAATGLAGVAYLLDDTLARLTDLAVGGVFVPLMLGELVLMAWLLHTARARPSGYVTPRPRRRA